MKFRICSAGKMCSLYVFCAVVMVADWTLVASEPVRHTVDTEVGRVIGLIENVTIDGQEKQFVRFLGIPYAEAPVGNLRFKKPIEKAPFPVPYDATYYRPACPQEHLVLPMGNETSEDCLVLNIFVPKGKENVPSDSYPVMVFIHGGAFLTGSSSYYYGDVLSVYGDVIVVTLNYRLGVLGFLSTEDGNIAGNNGLWDQQLALKWIQSHIASFQGDPKRVTLFGESQGSECIIHHALYPGNMGLFQRAIAESGTPVPVNSAGLVRHSGYLVADATRCALPHLTECLRAMSVEQIFRAISNSTNAITFGPVVDNAFIKFAPSSLLHDVSNATADIRDMFSSIDLVIGVNSMEGAAHLISFWAPLLQMPVNDLYISPDFFAEYMVTSTLSLIYEKEAADIPDVLKTAVLFQYTDQTDPNNANKTRDMALRLLSDSHFFIPSIKTASFHSSLSSKMNTFFYRLSARMSLRFPNTPSWLTGADHGDEIYFVFGFSNRMLVRFLYGKNFEPTSSEVILSKQVMTMWTNFAKTGNPNRPVNLDSIPDWPVYNATTKAYMDFSLDMSEKSDASYFGEPFTSFWLDLMTSIFSAVEAPEPTTAATTQVPTMSTPTTVTTTGYDVTTEEFSSVFHINSVTSDNIIIALIVISACLVIVVILLCAYALSIYSLKSHKFRGRRFN